MNKQRFHLTKKIIYKKMKKILLLFVTLCTFFTVFSQESEKIKTELRKNEIKITNPIFIVPGIEYERLVANNAVGLGFAFEPSLHWGNVAYVDDFFHWRISPYCRYYYKAFFIEANSALSKYEYINKFGMGLGMGCKLVSKKGFIGELFLGGGSYADNFKGGYLRFGLAFGKQF
jgi:hypothetical protein